MNRTEALNQARKLLPLAKMVTKAGARHSRQDTNILQQLHDMAVELGAKCNHEKDDDPLALIRGQAGRKLL